MGEGGLILNIYTLTFLDRESLILKRGFFLCVRSLSYAEFNHIHHLKKINLKKIKYN